jgi:hypothetical protein
MASVDDERPTCSKRLDSEVGGSMDVTVVVEAWPDYAGYQAKTARQIPVFVLESMA